MAESGSTRRRFLKVATAAIGGVIGAVLAVPIVRYVVFPVGRKVVVDAGDPVDVIASDALTAGAPPVRVQINAATVRDAWSVTRDVPLGSAWLRKTQAGEVVALSSACPHLGCAIDYDAADNEYKCPCHKSAFGPDGAKISGPSKRGLDPLPVEERDGRVYLTYVRYRPDISDREPV